MARKAKLVNIILDYIAKDDSAINVPEEELDEKYSTYLTTKDLTVLNVDWSKDPCVYKLKTFSTQKHGVYVMKALEVIKPFFDAKTDEPEEKDYEALGALWDEYYHYAALAIKDRLIGCTNHPMITGIDETGALQEVTVKWDVDKPQPAGLVEDILSQKGLVQEIFQFLVTASSLTERQKKH